jgi:hypothetical protein
VCFVEPRRHDPAGTLGRAWLITVEQLADVWAQENGHTSGPEIDVDRLVDTGHLDFGRRGWYGRLELVEELDGHPVATFTADDVPPLNPAHPSYLTVMGLGLGEAWDLSADEAARYLAGRRGNDGRIDVEALAESIRTESTLSFGGEPGA